MRKSIYLKEIIKCNFCGKEIKKTGPFQKYCDYCRKHKEYWIYRIHYRKRKNERQKNFKKKYPKKIREQTYRYYLKYRKDNPIYQQRISEWGKKLRLKKRKLVIEKYGGRCKCCGETKYEFLAIDHKNSDGTKHRAELRKKYSNIIEYALKNNFPNDLRVLCHNCNQARGFYGYCPHQKRI